jgi:hypothetical protein
MGGNFTTVWGEPRSGIARLQADGSLDHDFAPTNVPPDIRAIALEPDGQVVLGIGYPSAFMSPHPGIALLTTNGFLAPFASDISTNAMVHTLVVLPNGRLLVRGKFVRPVVIE